jgi:hypothetical protein
MTRRALDNARDSAQVRPLLPGSRSCLVVVTSRSRLAGLVAAEGAHPLGLDLLAEDEARQMLPGRLGADRLAAEPGAAQELTCLCARLPLALSIAAARAATNPRLSLGAIAADLRDIRYRLDVLEADESVSVRAAFSLVLPAAHRSGGAPVPAARPASGPRCLRSRRGQPRRRPRCRGAPRAGRADRRQPGARACSRPVRG